MYPAGHARNTTADLVDILKHKWNMLGEIALPDGGDVNGLVNGLESIGAIESHDLSSVYEFAIAERPGYEE